MDSLRKNNLQKNIIILKKLEHGPAEVKPKIIPAPELPKEPVHTEKPATTAETESVYPTVMEEDGDKKMSRKSGYLMAIALFLMIGAFTVLIGWSELTDHSTKTDLEKQLSKNTSGASTKLDNLKDSATPSSTSASSSAANQRANMPASSSISETPANDSSNIGTGVTSPEKTDNSNIESGTNPTYKDDKLGISFDYAAEYKISEKNGQIVVSKNSDTSMKMKLYDNTGKKEIKDWFDGNFPAKDNGGCSLSDPSTLKVGSYTTKLLKASSNDVKCDDGGYFAQNTDKSKIIKIGLDKATEDEANKILSTFKFLK